MKDTYEYTLKDMNTDFYFSNTDGKNRHQYVCLDELRWKYGAEWKENMRIVWLEFLEHCSYMFFNETHPEIKNLEHEFPSEFEPTLDMLVLMVVKRFDEKILSKDGWYLSDRAGHGYDLGLLSPLGRNWVKSFYENIDFNCLYQQLNGE